MKIALVGTGRMGQAVEALATRDGRHDVVVRFDEFNPLLDAPGREALFDAEVVIDFSVPDLAVHHIRRYCDFGIPAAIGTTGWYDHLEDARKIVDEAGGAIIYAPNFSIGVAILLYALRSVAPLLDRLPEYDLFVHDIHHSGKLDSPSGTALLLAEALLERVQRKQHLQKETQHGRIDPAALHVTSTRVGSIVGQHTVGFDSAYDTLTFQHEARSRDGFAFGAVKAAEWIITRKGLFTLDDLLDDWLE